MLKSFSNLLNGSDLRFIKTSNNALKAAVWDVNQINKLLGLNLTKEFNTISLPGVDDHFVIREFNHRDWSLCRVITHAKKICNVNSEFYDYKIRLDQIKKSDPNFFDDQTNVSRFGKIVTNDNNQRSILSAVHNSCLRDDYDPSIVYNLGLVNSDSDKLLNMMAFNRFILHVKSIILEKPFYILQQSPDIKLKIDLNNIDYIKKLYGDKWFDFNPYFVKDFGPVDIDDFLLKLDKINKLHTIITYLGGEGNAITNNNIDWVLSLL